MQWRGGGAYGIDVVTRGDGNVTIDAGGAITGSSIYGIRSRSYGMAADQTVTTEAGSTLTSGSAGIVVVNRATAIAGATTAPSPSMPMARSIPAARRTSPAMRRAASRPAIPVRPTAPAPTPTSTALVVVNNYANIFAAAGIGINAYNYGNGDVTVNSFAGTTISVAGT